MKLEKFTNCINLYIKSALEELELEGIKISFSDCIIENNIDLNKFVVYYNDQIVLTIDYNFLQNIVDIYYNKKDCV